MKSGRQRRVEILERRHRRGLSKRANPISREELLPRGALPADQTKLLHDNTYGPRPLFYVDRPFCCVDCGKNEVWTAAAQKWWYEEAKGKINSRADRCRDCRRKRRLRRSQERRVHIEGMIARHGFEDTARRLRLTSEALRALCARWSE